jgi:hypothetical protein
MNKVEKGVRGTGKVGKHSPTVNTNSSFVQNLIMTYADPCLSAIMNDRFRQKNAWVVAQRDWGQRTKINRSINITLPSTPTSLGFPSKMFCIFNFAHEFYMACQSHLYFPANSMQHSPLQETNSRSVTQEILRLLWNSKVNTTFKRTHNGPYHEPNERSPRNHTLSSSRFIFNLIALIVFRDQYEAPWIHT